MSLPSHHPRVTKAEICLVAGLLLIAVVFRVYLLRDFPLMIHNDEMNCGLEGRSVLTDPNRHFFQGTGWSGHPNFGYFLGGLSLLISDSLWGFRLGSAVIGVFSLLWIYLFMREGFGRRIALISIFLGATFYFHIYFSRIGTSFIHALFFIPLVMWIFLRALRDWGYVWWLAGGVALGLSLQVYPATHVLLPSLGVWGFSLLCFSEKEISVVRKIRSYCATVFGVIISVAPLIVHSFKGGTLGERSAGTFLFTTENLRHLSFQIGELTFFKVAWFQLEAMTRRLFFGGDSCVQFGYQGMLIGVLFPFVMWGGLVSLKSWRSPPHLMIALVTLFTWIFGGLLLVDPPALQRLVAFGVLLPALAAIGLGWTDRLSLGWRRSFVGGLLITWCGWNYATSIHFYRHQPIWYRDIVVRRLEVDRSIKGFLLVQDEEENMGHEAYLFMAPGVQVSQVKRGQITDGIASCLKPCAVAIPVMAGEAQNSIAKPLEVFWEQVSWPSDGGERSMYWGRVP